MVIPNQAQVSGGYTTVEVLPSVSRPQGPRWGEVVEVEVGLTNS